MCGICGRINFDGSPVSADLMVKMASLLSHRGPDDEGIYISKNAGLGHKRLSIIDLSEAGRQPMGNEDKTVWAVFNGEIYNFRELKSSLRENHRFISNTDTEVIVHLYEEKGIEFINYLRGMFAIAIWDEKRKRLLLARDRVGKKPVVYAEGKNSISFASELKSLLVDETFKCNINPVSIHHYLTYQYIPSPLTIFKEIKKLPPAHILICEDGEISLKNYWSLDFRKKEIFKDESGYSERFMEIFNEAVKMRLISDVPLGAFLSGGLDSSSVVAAMSRFSNSPVKTFSIGFEEEEYSELPYAKKVATKFNTEHHEFVVKPNAIEILPKIVWFYNEPFADSSAIPTYYVSKISREHVKVILNGDGGDELLAGYPRYLFSETADFFMKLPVSLRYSFLKRIVGSIPADKRVIWRLRKFLDNIALVPELAYLGRICYFDTQSKTELYTGGFSRNVCKEDSIELLINWFNNAKASNFLEKLLSVDTSSYLPDDLLVKVDIASMANSLEARSPFLDHKLMEFAASVPPEFKLRNKEGKYLLKKAMTGILPDEVIWRKKMGFGVPIKRWFKNELKSLVFDTLLSKKSIERGYFKKEILEKILSDHQSEKADNSYKIYALLMLELWHKMFYDSKIHITPPVL